MALLFYLTLCLFVGTLFAQQSFTNSIAHLSLFNSDAEAWSCTSSVIDDKWLLTAAHCLRGPDSKNLDLRISYAVALESRIPSPFEGKRYYFKSVFIHKNFKGSGFFSFFRRLLRITDDIGIIELEEPLPVGRYEKVSIAPLPLFGTVLTQVGYGRSLVESEFQISESATVYEAFSKCYGRETFMKQMLLSAERHMCTMKTTVDRDINCNADFGRPLLAKIDGTILQFGIASFGRPECSGPTWYTRLYPYRALIRSGEYRESFEKLTLENTDRGSFQSEEAAQGDESSIISSEEDEQGNSDDIPPMESVEPLLEKIPQSPLF